ncbi:TrmH family RNA methyltransferase [Arachidicoccus sp.]|uniref:TrmH family RNA methyltransferase n=1 Tax=Arachidicoccus sp. TaxID=1872624 RepID=UPI003D1A080E
MISKNELKYIQSLYHKKTRDRENVFIVEGPKMVDELLKSNLRTIKIFATRGEWSKNHTGSDFQEIEDFELKRISHFETPNQVLAIAKKKIPTNDIINFEDQVLLMLDGLQDPGNLGTIIRIADWFGIQTIIASEDTADCYNPKVIQASMGIIFIINIMYINLTPLLSECPTKVYGAVLNGVNLKKQEPIKNGVIIIGNESKGIREQVLPFIEKPITIEPLGKAESLNAAVAAGIILSHLIA